VGDVKLAPHGHLKAKNGDGGGNVQLLRRSVSGNSAVEETVADQPAANMSLSQHSSTDSQPRRDHNSDENQMTRSTGAVQNGTYKAPTAWSRGKGVSYSRFETVSETWVAGVVVYFRLFTGTRGRA